MGLCRCEYGHERKCFGHFLYSQLESDMMCFSIPVLIFSVVLNINTYPCHVRNIDKHQQWRNIDIKHAMMGLDGYVWAASIVNISELFRQPVDWKRIHYHARTAQQEVKVAFKLDYMWLIKSITIYFILFYKIYYNIFRSISCLHVFLRPYCRAYTQYVNTPRACT